MSVELKGYPVNLYSNILGLISDADVYNPSGFAL